MKDKASSTQRSAVSFHAPALVLEFSPPTLPSRPAPKPKPMAMPSVARRIWIPGVQYSGETEAQMIERERLLREEDERANAEVARQLACKLRPWWLDPVSPSAPRREAI